MPSVKINNVNLDLPVQTVRSRDGKWDNRTVTVNLSEDETMAKVGAKVCTGWQSFVALLYCCFGLSESYLADIGKKWFEKANLKGVGNIPIGSNEYSYLIDRTEVVANRVIQQRAAKKDERSKKGAEVAKPPAQFQQPALVSPAHSTETTGSERSGSDSDSTPSPKSRDIEEAGRIKSEADTPTYGSTGANHLQGLLSRQKATLGSEHRNVMRPGDALHLAHASSSKQPPRIELRPKEEVMARLARNIGPKDKIMGFRVTHFIPNDKGGNFQVQLNYILGSGSMPGAGATKTFLVPAVELITKGTEHSSVTVDIGAALRKQLEVMGRPVAQ